MISKNEESKLKEVIEYVISNYTKNQAISEACKCLSIIPDHLKQKSLSDFGIKNFRKESAEVWLKHYEARRRAKLIIIARYLVENNLLPQSKSNPDVNKSLSPLFVTRVETRSPNLTPKMDSSLKTAAIKKNIIRKITVENNLKILKTEQEIRCKSLENRLQAKSSRREKKISSEKIKKLENHHKHIQEILDKKHAEIDKHEIKALSAGVISRPVLKDNSVPVVNYAYKYSDDTNPKLDLSIERSLDSINLRLSKSAERAKKAMLEKASSGTLSFNQIYKVKSYKEQLDLNQEKKNIEKIAKISQTIFETCKRKQEILENQKKKTRKLIKQEQDHNSQCKLKLAESETYKTKTLEKKAELREKARQNIKNSIFKTSCAFSTKNSLKKKDHESKLTKLNQLHSLHKQKLLEKSLDPIPKQKSSQNLLHLKAKLEAELRTSLFSP